MAVVTPGSWTPTIALGGAGVTSAYGAARTFRDGIFIRSQFIKELTVESRMNQTVILKNAAERVPQVTSRKGQRYTFPTKSIPTVHDVTTSVVTSGYSYPDAYATDTFTAGGDRFTRTGTAGTSVLGVPLPMQRINEGEIELYINQHRGLAMLFTREYLEISMLDNPSSYYGGMIRYAMANDMDRYAWLAALYTGPITETADDYGSLFNDAIGITNRANYTLTRTLTSVGVSSSLITATTDGIAASMSNSSNSRFGTSPQNVPYLVGSTSSDVTYSTIRRITRLMNANNVPQGRKIFADSKMYDDISHLPQFVHMDVAGKESTVNVDGRMGNIHGFSVHDTNVIQPTGTSSNVLYGLAMGPDAMKYGVQREPDVIIDDMLNKKEQALVLMATARYGVTTQRPDHVFVIQTRTAA